MNPRDLNISLRAVSRPTHVLNGGPAGATFPGWFLQVQQNEGYDCVIEPTQLSIAQVKVITSEIDQLMDGTSRSLWRITHAAERCDNAMHDELKRQLAAAEESAARIPELRRRLGLEAT